MIRVLALVATLAPSCLAADPDRVSILLGSHHVGADFDFNEVNPGVFLTWEGENVDWSFGAYENSYSHTSVAATAYLPLIEWDGGEAGPFAGLALYPETGRYQQAHIGDVIPIGGLQVRHGNAFVQVIPAFGNGADVIVGLGVTFDLDRVGQ